ncbi:MAG: hypothetical protein B7Y43_03010 [Sphingomonas sp. 28-62-20]|uniref:NfeD family protein n=1 Tax=Sphingomonas sp. 28-62-20 TaxID=1970433 RepID=UPI000BCD04A2|nr:MAG: hypothetical protein B7Y43_03010 [Sphingomonas sp. 28-62-20]
MTLDGLIANAALLWLGAAILLGAAELMVPGVFLVFLAIAAAITGLAVFALPVLPLSAQLVAFALWSVVSILIGKRWYHDYPVATADPLLNDRGARLIGELVTVVTPIIQGEGRVKVGDGEWIAIGADAAAGERLRVTAIRDGKLVVTSQIMLD